MVALSVAPDDALKSPQIIRCSARFDDQEVSAAISESRALDESASRCVVMRLIVRPFTLTAASTATWSPPRSWDDAAVNGSFDTIMLPMPVEAPAPVTNL